METLSETLRREALKSEETQRALSKLDYQRQAERLWSFLFNIFESETQYLRERLVEVNLEAINLKDFYLSNLELFQKGLLTLCQIATDQIITTITDRGNLMRLETQHDTSSSEDNQNPERNRSRPRPIKTLERNITPSRRTGSTLATIEEIRGSTVLENGTPRNDLPDELKPRRSNVLLSSSTFNRFGICDFKSVPKIETSFYERLLQKSKRKSHNSSIDATTVTLPELNNSAMSKGGSKSLLNSEFNYVKGPVTFGRSKRRVFGGNRSPGPAAYQVQTSTSPKLKKNPAVIFGKANRKTWVETVNKTESPGPASLYPSKHLVLK